MAVFAVAGCAKRPPTYMMAAPGYSPAQYAYPQPSAAPPYAQTSPAAPAYVQAPPAAPSYAQPPVYAQTPAAPANPGGPLLCLYPNPAVTGTQAWANNGYYTAPCPANYGQSPYGQTYAPPAQQQAPTYADPRATYQQSYYAGPAPTEAYGSASAAPGYSLDAGDRLRIVVFGQEGLSNSYTVDASGNVTVPLIGAVPARGLTTGELGGAIAGRLKEGFIREPQVAIEIENYRPFFIMGEVTNPGQYPYSANLTMESAVAIAGGFSPRARRDHIEVTRLANGQPIRGIAPLNYPIQPGDTIRVPERWF